MRWKNDRIASLLVCVVLSQLAAAEAAVFSVTKTADTYDGTCSSTDCSLREAVSAANSSPGIDTIRFALPTATYRLTIPPSGGNGVASGDLNVQDDLVIEGNGTTKTVLDGNQVDRVIAIAPGRQVSLLDLSVRGGRLTDNRAGAGINNSGSLSLSNVVVEANNACNGGGLYNSGTVVFDSVRVTGNAAHSGGLCPTANTGFGGGVFNGTAGWVTLLQSLVLQNHADTNGGGIYNSEGTLTLTGGEIGNNSAGLYGGGIDSIGTIRISGNTSISGNTANDGGGISLREAAALLEASNSVFSFNSAIGGDLGGGGAVFNYRGEVILSDSSFSDNEARGEGGGAIENTGVLTVKRSTFTRNRAVYHSPNSLPSTTSPGFGGALLLINGGRVLLESVTLSDNDAAVSGGAIYNDRDSMLTVVDASVQGNSVSSANCGNGCRGGGILNEGDIDAYGLIVTANDAPLQGGGISHAVGRLTLRNSTISANVARNGGGIYNFGTAFLQGSTVSDNVATTDFGGGILNDREFTITNSTVSGNSAVVGGGISNNGPSALLTLHHATIAQNKAVNVASAIFNWKGLVSITNTILHGTCNNWHLNSGGVGDENPGSPLTQGGNLEGPGNSCALTHLTDRVGVSGMMLAPLDDNGGPSLTHALLSSSPAIDAGVDSFCPPIDQRLASRPADGDGDLVEKCDAGAYEYGATEPGPEIETMVDRYYRDILGRGPDAGGQAFWEFQIERMLLLGIDNREGFVVLAKMFFNSSEYIGKSKSPAQYVTDLYRTFFERVPTQSEVDFWVNRLAQGVSRNTILNYFVFSREFQSYVAMRFGIPWTRAENNLANDFYRGLLSRPPDDNGFQYWLGRIRVAQCAGNEAEIQRISLQVASLFLSSGEYSARQRDSREYIEDLYDGIMRRDGDPAGINFWVNALETGSMTREQVLAHFTQAAEFNSRIDDVVAAGCYLGP